MYRLLSGLTVVEGAAFIAGPSCGLHLAQMGASVIRFDQIGGGPDSRRWPLAPSGQSLYWEGLNKGKKSVALDLTRREGKELAQRLATAADGLFVTNFPAQGFLSHDHLSALRSDVITLRIMGWADGRPAVDYTINASAGLPLMTGHPDDPRPVNHVLPAWDLLTGAYGAFALLAAERERQQSGRGREVRLALSDMAAATMGNLGQVAEVLMGDADRARSGNALYGAFGRDFLTRDRARVMIVAITHRQWSGLVNALAIAPSIDALEAELAISFDDEGARFIHRQRLEPIIETAVLKLTMGEAAPLFDANGVTWSQYHTLQEAIATDARLFRDNPTFSTITHPSGTYPTPGAPARVPADARDPPLPCPRIGEHSDEVLAELLGLSSGQIGRLHDVGLVA